MIPIVSILKDGKQTHFYRDGTVSGVEMGCSIVNYFPLVIRQIRSAIYEIEKDGKPLSHFLDWFNSTIGVNFSVGSAQGTEENSINILSHDGDAHGGK